MRERGLTLRSRLVYECRLCIRRTIFFSQSLKKALEQPQCIHITEAKKDPVKAADGLLNQSESSRHFNAHPHAATVVEQEALVHGKYPVDPES